MLSLIISTSSATARNTLTMASVMRSQPGRCSMPKWMRSNAWARALRTYQTITDTASGISRSLPATSRPIAISTTAKAMDM